MSFDNANIFCAGDSLTVGYLPANIGNGAEVASNGGWTALFKDKIGVPTLKNLANGGARFGGTTTNSILKWLQVGQYNNGNNNGLNSRTHIIIAAGTNDYYYQTSKNNFTTALNEVATYINSQKSSTAEVIFITPVNTTRLPEGGVETTTLNWYRKEITKCALLNGYSVIDGREFGFPEEVNEYQAEVMTDGVHPTELGYEIYANKMCDLLLDANFAEVKYLKDQLAELLYKAPSITYFGTSTYVFETGTAPSITLSWTISKGTNDYTTKINGTVVTGTSKTVNPTSTTSYTLTAIDSIKKKEVSKGCTITFVNASYIGVSANIINTINGAKNSLTKKLYTQLSSFSGTYECSNTYIYMLIPKAISSKTPSFRMGDFSGGFTSVASDDNYTLYRSNQLQAKPIYITVS
jgi:lysophospholipase L1-like esterase